MLPYCPRRRRAGSGAMVASNAPLLVTVHPTNCVVLRFSKEVSDRLLTTHSQFALTTARPASLVTSSRGLPTAALPNSPNDMYGPGGRDSPPDDDGCRRAPSSKDADRSPSPSDHRSSLSPVPTLLEGLEPPSLQYDGLYFASPGDCFFSLEDLLPSTSPAVMDGGRDTVYDSTANRSDHSGQRGEEKKAEVKVKEDDEESKAADDSEQGGGAPAFGEDEKGNARPGKKRDQRTDLPCSKCHKKNWEHGSSLCRHEKKCKAQPPPPAADHASSSADAVQEHKTPPEREGRKRRGRAVPLHEDADRDSPSRRRASSQGPANAPDARMAAPPPPDHLPPPPGAPRPATVLAFEPLGAAHIPHPEEHPPAPMPAVNDPEQWYDGELTPNTVHLHARTPQDYTVTFTVNADADIERDYEGDYNWLLFPGMQWRPVRPAAMFEQPPQGTWVVHLRRSDLLPPQQIIQGRLTVTLRGPGLRDVHFSVRYCRDCNHLANAPHATSSAIPAAGASVNLRWRPGSSGPATPSSSGGSAPPAGPPGRDGRQQQEWTSSSAMQLEDELDAGPQRLVVHDSAEEPTAGLDVDDEMPSLVAGLSIGGSAEGVVWPLVERQLRARLHAVADIVDRFYRLVEVGWYASFAPSRSGVNRSLSRWADPPLPPKTLILRMPDSSMLPENDRGMQLLPLASISFVPLDSTLTHRMKALVARLRLDKRGFEWIDASSDKVANVAGPLWSSSTGVPPIAVFANHVVWTMRYSQARLGGRRCELVLELHMMLYPEHDKQYTIALTDSATGRRMKSGFHDHRFKALDELMDLWVAEGWSAAVGDLGPCKEHAVMDGRFVYQQLESQWVAANSRTEYRLRHLDLESLPPVHLQGAWHPSTHEAVTSARSAFSRLVIHGRSAGVTWHQFRWRLRSTASSDGPEPTARGTNASSPFDTDRMSSIISCSHTGHIVKGKVTLSLLPALPHSSLCALTLSAPHLSCPALYACAVQLEERLADALYLHPYRRFFAPVFLSGDQTQVERLTIDLLDDGRVSISAKHSTAIVKNKDYIHTSILFFDEQGEEVAILPKPTRARNDQGGVEREDEEYQGPALSRDYQSELFRLNWEYRLPARLTPEEARRCRSVQVFTRG